MKIYFNTLGLDTELLEYFEWDEDVKSECVNFILKLFQDKKMDSVEKLKSTLNLTYGEDVSLIVERYIIRLGEKMKPFEQLLRNNKITVKEYLEINNISKYEEHLEDAHKRNLEPLDNDVFNKALDILNPKTKLEKESVPESKKKKNTRRGRKRKGEK